MEEEVVIPDVQCGDDVCSESESCTTCAGDCGECPAGWIGVMQEELRRAMRLVRYYLAHGIKFVGEYASLEDAVTFIEEHQKTMEANALQRSDAAQELLTFLEEHDRLNRHVSTIDRRLIHMVGEGEGKIALLNGVPSIRVSQAMRGAVANERKELSTLTTLLLMDPTVQAYLDAPERVQQLAAAAERGEVSTVANTLPTPRRSFPILRSELVELQEAFAPPMEHRAEGGMLLPKVLAQEVPVEKTSQESFAESVRLLQEMRHMAQDQNSVGPSIEENIAYLQNRGNLIAGVIDMPEEKYTETLDGASKGEGESRSREGTLNAAGALRFISQSENFQHFEGTLITAKERLLSPFAFITRWFQDEEAEAKFLTEEEAMNPEFTTVGSSSSLEEKREAILTILQPRAEEVTTLLMELPEEDQVAFQGRIQEWEQALRSSDNVESLEQSLEIFRSIADDIERTVRKRRSAFFRFIYFFQDLFSIA